MYSKIFPLTKDKFSPSVDYLESLKNVFVKHLLYQDSMGVWWPKDIDERDAKVLKKIISKKSIAYRALDHKTIFTSSEEVFEKIKSFAKYLREGKLVIEVEPVKFANNRLPLVFFDRVNSEILISASLFPENLFLLYGDKIKEFLIVRKIDIDEVQHTFFAIRDVDINRALAELNKICKASNRVFALDVLERLPHAYNEALAKKEQKGLIPLITTSKIFERVDGEISMIDWILNSVANFNEKYKVDIPIRFIVGSEEDKKDYEKYLQGYPKVAYLKKVSFSYQKNAQPDNDDALYLNIAPENIIFSSQVLSLRNIFLMAFAADGLEKQGLDLVNFMYDMDIKVGNDIESDDHKKRHSGKNKPHIINLRRGISSVSNPKVGVINIERSWGYASLHKSQDLYKVPNDLTLLYYNYLLPYSINNPKGQDYGKLYISNKYVADEADYAKMFKGEIYIGSQSKVVIDAEVQIDGRLVIPDRTPLFEIVSYSKYRPAFKIFENTEVCVEPGQITEIILLQKGYLQILARPYLLKKTNEYGIEMGEEIINPKVVLVSQVVDRYVNYSEVFDNNLREALDYFIEHGDIVIVDDDYDNMVLLRNEFFKISNKLSENNFKIFTSIEEFKKAYSPEKRKKGEVRDVSLIILDNNFSNHQSVIGKKKVKLVKLENDNKGVKSVPEIRRLFPESAIILNTKEAIKDDVLRELWSEGEFEVFISLKGRYLDIGMFSDENSFDWLTVDIINAKRWHKNKLIHK